MTDTADASLPADWPALWQAILRAHHAAAPVPINGSWSPSSTALLATYAPLLGSDWCIAQLGQSLDGCVATHSGDSYFVTGPQSLLHLHRLRALCDAVLVGAGTVAADNPQLTTRRVPGANPTRVVLDPTARLDGRARLMHDGQAPTLWLCDARHRQEAHAKVAAGDPSTVEVLGVEGLCAASSGFHPAAVIAALAARGLRRLFVEGGGVTVTRFLDAGCLDRLHLVIAPVFIGAGRRGIQLPPRATMADCLRPAARLLPLGDDVLWDLALR